jgi:anti-sigma B factor antagonist
MATLNIMAEEARGEVPVTVLHLQGDIDAATHAALTAKAEEVIAAGTSNILLDLSGVGYMGSAGFRALHAISNMLESESGTGMGKSKRLKLLSPTDDVARVIKTLGFNVYLDTYENQEEAVRSF